MEKNMKSLMGSKYMILFIVLMLGITYINSLGVEKLNNQKINTNEVIINK